MPANTLFGYFSPTAVKKKKATATASGGLSEEQKSRIAANKRKALARQKEKRASLESTNRAGDGSAKDAEVKKAKEVEQKQEQAEEKAQEAKKLDMDADDIMQEEESEDEQPKKRLRRLRKRKPVVYAFDEDDDTAPQADDAYEPTCEEALPDDESDNEAPQQKKRRRTTTLPSKPAEHSPKENIAVPRPQTNGNSSNTGEGQDIDSMYSAFKKGGTSQGIKSEKASKRSASWAKKAQPAEEGKADGKTDGGKKVDKSMDMHGLSDWMQPSMIRDMNNKRPDEPGYDPRTILIPQSAWKTFTPGQKQYWQIKQQHYDVVLFFKVGKFYEIFDMDAHIGARMLNLSYMKSSKRPHVGFPEMAYEKYAEQLVQMGYKVGRVEQMETPKQLAERNAMMPRGKKQSAVRREMCQILTRGTLTDENLIGRQDASYLLSICEDEAAGEYGVCFVDTSTGKFHVGQFSDDRQKTRLRTLLAQIKPEELCYPREGLGQITQRVLKNECAASVLRQAMTPETEFWTATDTLDELKKAKYFESTDTKLAKLDEASKLPMVVATLSSEQKDLAVSALGGTVSYLRRLLLDTELVSGAEFKEYHPSHAASSEFLVLDGQTLNNLDIIRNQDGGVEGTLLKHVDHTVTAFGKRLLREWVSRPLAQIEAIDARLDSVEDLVCDTDLLDNVRKALKLPDLERMLARIHAHAIKKEGAQAVMYQNVGKKKVKLFVDTLKGFGKAMELPALFMGGKSQLKSQRLKDIGTIGNEFPDLSKELAFFDSSFDHARALRDGCIYPRAGVDEDYDRISEIVDQFETDLQEYLQSQRKHFKNSKIRYVDRGKEVYQLEIPREALDRADLPDDFAQLSTTKKVRRFMSPVVKHIIPQLEEAKEEQDILLKDLTRKMFAKFCEHFQKWHAAVRCLAELDVLCSLALTSCYQDGDSRRPEFLDPEVTGGPVLELRDAIHPALASASGGTSSFIPNDTVMGDKENKARFLLVSGPNMGGKSTLLRQTCIAVIMAQLGCYVPATLCRLTPVDRIFTRVGANDRIMQGQSTFLVELEETANILRHATSRSLVILDELGRGTSTFDGTAIAYSVIHFLCQKTPCLTLFSTHYHMLMEEFADDPLIAMYHMACTVEKGGTDVTFLYKFKKGCCPKSYGMNVAKLAGLPTAVTLRAREMSENFEVRLELAHRKRDRRGSPHDVELALRVKAAVAAGDIDALRHLHALSKSNHLQAESR